MKLPFLIAVKGLGLLKVWIEGDNFQQVKDRVIGADAAPLVDVLQENKGVGCWRTSEIGGLSEDLTRQPIVEGLVMAGSTPLRRIGS